VCSANVVPAVPEIPVLERRNWFIYLLYVRKEYDECKVGVASETLHQEGFLLLLGNGSFHARSEPAVL